MPVYSGTIKQQNFCILPMTGASGNTGKGYYKVVVTSGGTSTPTPYTHYIRGMTSTFTAIVMNTTNTSGTWAGGDWAGSIHISQATGTFTDGEALGLYLVSDDSQVSADVATFTASSYAIDAFALIDHATAAKGLATTAPIVGIAKSTAPTSTGVTASVTKLSKDVTLSGAVTLDVNVCNATTGWTNDNSSSAMTAAASSSKQTSCLTGSLPASPVANTLYYHYTISTGSDTDYSAYQQLNFWFRPSVSADGNKFVVKLCSDEAGTTAVHTFTLDKVTSNTQWIPYVFDNGAALGSNIRSFAIYSGASAPSTNSFFKIDNIFLSKAPSSADSLTLKSLISFSSADNVQDNAWYPVKSIVGTALVIDNHVNANYNEGRGFSEDTVTSQTLYKREAFTVFTNTSSSTACQTTQVAGTNGTYIEFQGGINMQTLVQEGYTFYTGDNGWGYGITIDKNLLSINRIGLVRYIGGIVFSPSGTAFKIKDFVSIGCGNPLAVSVAVNIILDGYFNAVNNLNIINMTGANVLATSNSTMRVNGTSGNAGITLQTFKAIFNKLYLYNNNTYGLQLRGQATVKELYTRDNATASIIFDATTATTQIKCGLASIAESTEVSFPATQPNYGIAYLGQLGGTANNDQVVFPAGRAYMQASEKPADVSFAWKLSPTSNIYRSWTPLMLRISPPEGFFVEASKQVTIKARLKVSNANITAGILVPALQAGLTADQVVTSVSTNASWGEEVTLQFTPPASGAIEVFFIAYYPDTSSTHTYSAYLAAPVAVDGVYTMFTQAT